MDLIPQTSYGSEESQWELKMSKAALALAEIETTKVVREEATVSTDQVEKRL